MTGQWAIVLRLSHCSITLKLLLYYDINTNSKKNTPFNSHKSYQVGKTLKIKIMILHV